MAVSIADFERVVFFTGAGLSKASGIPTFRGKGGIWKQYEPQRYACQAAFERDPEAVWEFHNYRRGIVGPCKPNGAHELIAKVQGTQPKGTKGQSIAASIITQNIDGLHQAAGATQVVEFHGSLWHVRDQATGELREDHSVPFTDLRTESGGYWRPSIVWFGDMLDPEVLRQADDIVRDADLLVSIGTSGVVYPAANIPVVAKDHCAVTVELNPEETAVSSYFDHTMRMGAVEGMQRLCEGLWV